MPILLDGLPLAQNSNPRFDTHRVYIKFLYGKSDGLRITSAPKLIGDMTVDAYQSKLKIIELTKQSILNELSVLDIDPDYGEPASLWIPVKAYYLLYHQISALHYLISADARCIRESHKDALAWYATLIRDNALVFSQSEFNRTVDSNIVDQVFCRQGELLSNACDDEKKLKSLLKKACRDRLDEHKRAASLKLQKPVDKKKYQKYAQSLHLTIMDFFYITRVRSNYRNVDFTHGVSSERVARYASHWGKTGLQISKAFEELAVRAHTD